VANPLNHARVQRPLAVLFLGLVLAGVVAGAVRAILHDTAAQPATGLVVWPANGEGLRTRLAAVGLPALSREGRAFHIHAHLDVFVAGRPVIVPAGIGIDPAGRFISPIHTHDATGVIHVESPVVRKFTLGQFFGVWGVRLGGGCLGEYCSGSGSSLRVYADGNPVGDPSRLVLAAHQEIVVAFGTLAQLPRPVPVSYSFQRGL
jgi:hypothetical protein